MGPCRSSNSSPPARCTEHQRRIPSKLNIHTSSTDNAQVGKYAELVAAIVGRGVVGAWVATSHVSSVFVLYAGVGGTKLLKMRGPDVGLEGCSSTCWLEAIGCAFLVVCFKLHEGRRRKETALEGGPALTPRPPFPLTSVPGKLLRRQSWARPDWSSGHGEPLHQRSSVGSRPSWPGTTNLTSRPQKESRPR